MGKVKLVLGALFLIVFMVNLVSAQISTIPPGARNLNDVGSADNFFADLQQNRIVRLIVGDFSFGDAGASELFFIKVLVSLLMLKVSTDPTYFFDSLKNIIIGRAKIRKTGTDISKGAIRESANGSVIKIPTTKPKELEKFPIPETLDL